MALLRSGFLAAREKIHRRLKESKCCLGVYVELF